jgi:hypothetical protein
MRQHGVFGSRDRTAAPPATTAGSRQRTREGGAASVKIDSKVFPILDISESGFVIDEYQGDLVVKQRFYFDLVVPVGDKEQTYRTEALAVKVDGTRLVGKFLDARRDLQRAVQYVIAHRKP